MAEKVTLHAPAMYRRTHESVPITYLESYKKKGKSVTALKPIENLQVKGVASKRYPINHQCAHPNCTDEADDVHHIFPRSLIGNDSYFVQIQGEDTIILPHAIGLCRNHHNDVEHHNSWIRLENDLFVWYDLYNSSAEWVAEGGEWSEVGPLNPQPGGREKIKKKNKRGNGSTETRRNRIVVSYRVPKDEREDGAGILDDLIDQLEEQMGYDPHRPAYYTLVDGLYIALTAPMGDE